MKVEWHLSKEKKEQLDKMKSPKKKRKEEKLSRKDIEELMNMHVDTYKRGRGGAIRRK